MRTRIAIIVLVGIVSAARAQQRVTLIEDQTSYTLDNGIVTAMIAKDSGDLLSMRYKSMEMLATIMDASGKPDLKADPSGGNDRGFGPFTDHQYGFWSHDAMGPRDTAKAIPTVTIDPKSNGGQRAEVAIRGISNGRKMGTGPGTNAQGNFISDIEIRWALGQGDSGVYTYCVFEHKPEYPGSTITEARFCVKLNAFFDWMSVGQDEHHNKLYPASLREGDKYIYTTNQYNNRAFGWSSTSNNVGLFIINPSMEYMSGGPTKVEFLGHRDTNQVAAPCVLNYWRSSHYGGAGVSVASGEQWAKVIGPFMLYVNSGADSQAIYADARAQAVKEEQKWPFDWVSSVDYPTSKDRATVKGQLVLTDPQQPATQLPNLLVGLTAPAFSAGGRGPGGGRMIDWQEDAKHYEFWVKGKDDGQFEIPDVRPGTYTMHAFADGVLGEYAKADITIETGKNLDMGKITWTPVRRGKQVWDIGIPNRYGSEFFKAEVYWQPTIGQQYATLFPEDLTYTIGKSDYHKDWFFQHVPHYDPAFTPPAPAGGGRRGGGPASGPAAARGNVPATNPALARGGAPATGPARGGFAPPSYGKAAPRTIVFSMPNAPRGKATLRIAMSGTGSPNIDVTVNDKSAGQLSLAGFGDGVLSSHGTHGLWHEHEFAFDATMLKQGENKLVLTVPAGQLTAGNIYDYLRLELDEAAVATAAAAQ